jgi:hypothetical protein
MSDGCPLTGKQIGSSDVRRRHHVDGMLIYGRERNRRPRIERVTDQNRGLYKTAGEQLQLSDERIRIT